VSTPEFEHDFEEILQANWTAEEREALGDEAQDLAPARISNRRSGPGILRQHKMFGEPIGQGPREDIDCNGCGEEIDVSLPYWSTYWGPFHPECFGEE